MRGRWIVGLTLSAFAAASVASAGHPQERHGFWFALGGGVGSARVTCDGCGDGDRETSGVVHLAFGGTLGKNVLLGADYNVWVKQREEFATVALGTGLLTITVYPDSSGGFFLKAGGGISVAHNDAIRGRTTISVDYGTGFGLVGGAGYDIRAWKNTSITPAVSYWYGSHGDVTAGGATLFRNWKYTVVDFTFSFTFH